MLTTASMNFLARPRCLWGCEGRFSDVYLFCVVKLY